MRKAYRGAMRLLIRSCASGGLAVSTEAGNDLFSWKWRGSSRWTLQHLGIDLSQFDIKVDRNSLRRELGIPADALVVGHVGRFTAEKNHSFLVEIAREMSKCEPRVFFLLVGDGPLRSTIEEKVAAYSLEDRFLFTGVRPDVPRLMKGAMDMFLFPSTREGLPITLLEAQAAGLKCLVSDVVSSEADVIPELILRVLLALGPAKWAAHLLSQPQRSNCMPFSVTSRRLAERSIVASTEQLSSRYAKHCHV
jgi:glycosyltransferase involved in cell wall biosynthesis